MKHIRHLFAVLVSLVTITNNAAGQDSGAATAENDLKAAYCYGALKMDVSAPECPMFNDDASEKKPWLAKQPMPEFCKTTFARMGQLYDYLVARGYRGDLYWTSAAAEEMGQAQEDYQDCEDTIYQLGDSATQSEKECAANCETQIQSKENGSGVTDVLACFQEHHCFVPDACAQIAKCSDLSFLP